MVASGSRTMIAGSLSSCIAGFRQSCRFSPSSDPRRSCVGTRPAFAATGVGSRAHREGDRRSIGAARIDPADEHGKSALGRATHPRRTAQGPPSQEWRTFLRNHAPDIAAMDLFVVPTIGFDLLYAFVIIRLDRRDLIWINVTANPTAEWVARQITEAFPWDKAPHYLIRDRDRIYGSVVTRRLRAMGIRDKPTAPASPWQNGFAERLIGSIRRECVDHIIVLGEMHLRRILRSYADYYNR